MVADFVYLNKSKYGLNKIIKMNLELIISQRSKAQTGMVNNIFCFVLFFR
jgi:hypothetical protein